MIPPRLHATLDAVSVAALIAGPSLLGWPRRAVRPLALAGLGVAAYSLATRYRRGSSGALTLAEHRVLDAAQGIAVAGTALSEPDRVIRQAMMGYAAFSFAAALLTSPEGPKGVPLPRAAWAPATRRGDVWELAPDLAYLRLGIVNVAFIGTSDDWVLVDAGLPGTAGAILSAARRRFGNVPPRAILMTHGHFDHVGALRTLADHWQVPVFAHPQERPFLDGTRSYPPAAPEVGGGMMATTSPVFPRSPVDVSDHLHDLPVHGSIPHLDGWSWIHTPGHAPGHVSLWHEGRRVLLSGDAIVTTRQESACGAAMQMPELHGPPAYFTSDWQAAAASVRRLRDLDPALIVAGHGHAVAGPHMTAALDLLAHRFRELGLPATSRYLTGRGGA
ncbi:MBL fold metallo-hydrolase [Falsirhodobacter deserti]|uniref:MBL fold metallo-hydrolase n=1 Tax=Falsirhodobacter deserti TaxID=1365611 RepID=UPI0019D4BC88|nr:MBL fold metallo-hydrolase [Falsirhodobacter deserti]